MRIKIIFHTLYNIRKTNIEISKKGINLKKETIDIDNFINYFATELYIANPDWPRHNVAVWRTLYEGSKNKYAEIYTLRHKCYGYIKRI